MNPASRERWERVGLTAAMVLLLAGTGLVFGVTAFAIISAIAGIPIDHLSYGEALASNVVVIGSIAVFGVAGGIFAWRAPLSRVRIAVTIVGVVVTSVIAVEALFMWMGSL